MNIHSGAKFAVTTAALVLALLVPDVAGAQPTGRRVSKLSPQTAALARSLLARFELNVVNNDVRQLLAMMRQIVNQPVLNRDVLLDNNSGLREVGRIPLRDNLRLSPTRETVTGTGEGLGAGFPVSGFPFFGSTSSTAR